MIALENFFPTTIGKIKDLEFTNKVLKISSPILDDAPFNHRLGYKSTYLNETASRKLEEYEWINEYLIKISIQYLKKLSYRPSHPLIPNYFLSRSGKKTGIEPHFHPNSILSGVIYLYLECNDEAIAHPPPRHVLEFRDTRLGKYFNQLEPTLPETIYNKRQVQFEPMIGDIFIWESYIEHSAKNLIWDRRDTLVFNIHI